MTRFLALPNELIHTIAGYTESRDLLALCQTNLQIHNICLEWIYRSITLDDPARLVKCCKTIISHAEAADVVRKLTISCCPRRAVKSYYETVGAAIRKLKNLQSLDACRSLTLFRLFSATQFPQLSECVLPSSVEVMPFLERHAMIYNLRVFPYEDPLPKSSVVTIDRDTIFNFTSPVQPIHMPKLQEFVGPTALAYAVVPGSSTSLIAIYWGNESMDSSGVATLARSNVDVIHLQNVVHTWDYQLLSAIAVHMPRLEKLMFRNMRDLQEKQLFFSCIDDTLRSLACLTSISLFEGLPADPQDDDVEEEFQTAYRWGEIAPMLTDITFPSNTPWTRLPIPLGMWLPGIDIKRPRFEDLNIKSFYIVVLTSPVALPAKYYTLAQNLAGPDALHAVEEAIDNGEAIPDFVPTHDPLQPFRLVSNDDA
ncbi:hypothetical protein C8R44DRAFT_973613 [Mycena epipterygia]|nr:hypothetical protein C8R44DRAFT_973613 [Mycena epipterygia]